MGQRVHIVLYEVASLAANWSVFWSSVVYVARLISVVEAPNTNEALANGVAARKVPNE